MTAARRKAVAAPLTAGCAVSSSCSAWSLMFAAQQACVRRVGAGLWEEGTSTSSGYKHHFSHHGRVSSGAAAPSRATARYNLSGEPWRCLSSVRRFAKNLCTGQTPWPARVKSPPNKIATPRHATPHHTVTGFSAISIRFLIGNTPQPYVNRLCRSTQGGCCSWQLRSDRGFLFRDQAPAVRRKAVAA